MCPAAVIDNAVKSQTEAVHSSNVLCLHQVFTTICIVGHSGLFAGEFPQQDCSRSYLANSINPQVSAHPEILRPFRCMQQTFCLRVRPLREAPQTVHSQPAKTKIPRCGVDWASVASVENDCLRSMESIRHSQNHRL